MVKFVMRQKVPVLLFALWVAISPTSALAEARLRCQITLGGQTQVREFAMTSDPYRVPALDLNRHFRFKAVVIGDASRLEYVKIYTYYQTPRQPVLLHLAHYPVPRVPAGNAPDALTGTHTLYSPNLGRELQYGCTLFEASSQ